MLDLITIFVSALAEIYNTVDWGRASDFTAVVRDTVETLTLVVGSTQGQRKDIEKDDEGSGKP